MTIAVESTNPVLPPRVSVAEITALKAIFAGSASEQQQKAGMAWIVHQAAGLDFLAWYPGSEGQRASDFAQGKRSVGLNIKRVIEMSAADVEALAAKEKERRHG